MQLFRLHHLLLLVVLLTTVDPTGSCGPGGGAGRRRPGRKMTPLVFKQHVPNVSENSLGGSGPPEGRITRNGGGSSSAADDRFNELVVNNNPEILFKDADGTGSDRFMSQRCREKLNALSILVVNQWPGVKVRVTAGWTDDTMLGPADSLHYEGRAVDITTSDRDRSKYGMLARLAVEAGFDWVYYESRGHIHCSVKSDSSIATGSHGCFPRHATVRLETGQTRAMDELRVGDRVKTFEPRTGQLRFDDVVAFLDRSAVTRRPETAVYLTVVTENGHQLTLTPAHLIYTSDKPDVTWSDDIRPVFADRLQTGSYVFVGDGNATDGVQTKTIAYAYPSKISRIETTVGKSRDLGFYAPLTERGTIVVDDVIASCYAVFGNHDVAHVATAPVRYSYSVDRFLRQWLSPPMLSPLPFPVRNASSSVAVGTDGVHWYADVLRTVAGFVLPRDYWWYAAV
jgi:hypothetical protein